MASTINTNINSLTAQRNLSMSQSSLSTSMQRLSSGLRINSAKDDAAGLAIADRFTAQIRGNTQAARNANDGISLAQTAEGALGSIGTNLQRIRELSVQSANATNSASDRAALQQEVGQLASEIERVATQTQFNGINLLDGSFTAQAFQVGANVGQTITVSSIDSARGSDLGKYNGVNLTNASIGTASNTAAAQSITVGGTTYNLGSIANDAKAITNAINAQNIAGMTVTAGATNVAAGTQAVTTTTAGTATLSVNGVTLTLNATTDAATNRSNAVTAFNNASASTGVVATDTGAGVSLKAADGRNIDISGFTLGSAVATTIADFGLAPAATTGGTLNIDYVAPTGVTGTVSSTGAWALAATNIAQTGTAVNALDISTVAGANSAIKSVDAALSNINSSRATLGAIQNRFSSTVENLQTSAENLSASRSRIQDADFASETANLSRAQILQQAGTAMVAQANQLPQGVLALLR
ncbi:MAG: flagellin [Betaproteobacteria bacterium]|nr:flagellin [Betaproteobacteria bacterium]